MAEIRLIVNGSRYGGWKSASVTRSIESLCGSFTLTASDRWAGQATSWPIHSGDECQIFIGDVPVITGYVDSRSVSYNAKNRTVTLRGRDRAGDLVDCSALLDKWEFTSISLLALAKKLCNPYGVDVGLQSGFNPVVSGKLTIDPGDTVFGVLERACRLAACLAVSDGQGGIVLTRSGSDRCSTALVEGENILSASRDSDASGRYRTYRVVGQRPGSDSESGATVARVKGEATDLGITRSSRVLLVRSEGSVTSAYARARAQWESVIRAARGEDVRVAVQGWHQGNGVLWPVNALVPIRSSTLEIDGSMIVAGVTHSIDDTTGQITDLILRRPDAFAPEPSLPAPQNCAIRWTELD